MAARFPKAVVRIRKSVAWVVVFAGLISLAMCLFPSPGLAQPFSHPTVRVCDTGPAPQVTPADVRAVYVHLSWPPVPGAVAYYIYRLNTTLPNQSHVNLTPTLPPGSFQYWDAVPSPSYSYQYSIMAVQADNCYGTTTITVPQTTFRTPNPQYVFATRMRSATGAPNLTDGKLIWSGVFGATAYRIDGPGMGGYGTYLTAGTYNQGTMPTPGPFTAPLNGQNTNYYYYNASDLISSCGICTYSFPLKDLGADEQDYKVTAIYYGNFADYIHATAATIPRLTCSAGTPSPSSGLQGTKVLLNQGRGLSFTNWVGILYDYDPDEPGTVWTAGTRTFVPGSGNLLSDQQLIIDTTTLAYPPRVKAPFSGHFVVTTVGGQCNSTPYSVTTTAPAMTPTTGSLSVSVGYTAGPGETCQGQATIGIQPGPGTAGTAPANVTHPFSGVSTAETVGGTPTRGCLVSKIFTNLAPGLWNVTAGYPPSGAVGHCAAAVISNQSSSDLVWDYNCF